MFSSLFSKLLHKRENEKMDAQEENFLPKYQRVKDLCQRAEYQSACEQLGQVRNQPDLKCSTQKYSEVMNLKLIEL